MTYRTYVSDFKLLVIQIYFFLYHYPDISFNDKFYVLYEICSP